MALTSESRGDAKPSDGPAVSSFPVLDSRESGMRDVPTRAIAWGSGGCTIGNRLVDCANRPGSPGHIRETALGLFDGRNRRHVAVVITTDGRRVPMPLNTTGLSDGSLLSLVRSLLLGLDGLVGLLITGSRRENGGTRRNGR